MMKKYFLNIIKKLDKKQKIAIGILGLTVLYFIILSIAPKSAPTAYTAPKTNVASFLSKANLESVPILVPGKIEHKNYTIVKARIMGEIIKILKTEGTKVIEGEKVLELRKETQDEELTEAKSTMREKQIQLDITKSLDAKDMTAKTHLASAKADFNRSKTQYERKKMQEEFLAPDAPYDGNIGEIMVKKGDLVQIGTPLFTISSKGNYEIITYVNEDDVFKIQKGSKAKIMIRGKEYKGHVISISNIINEQNKSFKVKIKPESTEIFPHGIGCNVKLITKPILMHKIKTHMLDIGSSGDIGVKTIKDGKIEFVKINIISADNDNLWVKIDGKEDEINIIEYGIKNVNTGDKIE